MTFVHTEYEDKKSGTRAMNTAKNKVFIRLLFENCYLVGDELLVGGDKNLVGGDKNLVRRKSSTERIFPRRGR